MDVSVHLSSVAKILKCNFTLRDQPVSYEQVFSTTGLLPAFMRRAEQLSNFCLGCGLGLTFANTEKAMLGVEVGFDDKTPNTLRALCAVDVLIEVMQAAPNYDKTPLDDLMYD